MDFAMLFSLLSLFSPQFTMGDLATVTINKNKNKGADGTLSNIPFERFFLTEYKFMKSLN